MFYILAEYIKNPEVSIRKVCLECIKYLLDNPVEGIDVNKIQFTFIHALSDSSEEVKEMANEILIKIQKNQEGIKKQKEETPKRMRELEKQKDSIEKLLKSLDEQTEILMDSEVELKNMLEETLKQEKEVIEAQVTLFQKQNEHLEKQEGIIKRKELIQRHQSSLKEEKIKLMTTFEFMGRDPEQVELNMEMESELKEKLEKRKEATKRLNHQIDAHKKFIKVTNRILPHLDEKDKCQDTLKSVKEQKEKLHKKKKSINEEIKQLITKQEELGKKITAYKTELQQKKMLTLKDLEKKHISQNIKEKLQAAETEMKMINASFEKELKDIFLKKRQDEIRIQKLTVSHYCQNVKNITVNFKFPSSNYSNEFDQHFISDTSFKWLNRYLLLIKGIQVKKEIGSGNFGLVFEGTYNGKNVAIKINNSNSISGFQELMRSRFLKEECIIFFYLLFFSGISHPNIIDTIDYIEELQALVLEFAEGFDGCTDLQKFLEKQKAPINVNLRFKFISQICSAMSYLHSKKILHRKFFFFF